MLGLHKFRLWLVTRNQTEACFWSADILARDVAWKQQVVQEKTIQVQ